MAATTTAPTTCVPVSPCSTRSAGCARKENQYLVNPPEIAREYSEKLQRLIGYDYGGPYLGFAHTDDPRRVLVNGHEGPPRRSSPEVDRAAKDVEWLRYGELEPEPTPVRSDRPTGSLLIHPEG